MGISTLLVSLGSQSTFCYQANAKGSWTNPIPLTTHAIHAISLATGKMLFWTGNGYTFLYDPVTRGVTPAATAPFNIFCSGHTVLGDGRVFVAGGHVTNNNGLANAAIYDPFSDSWSSLPDMATKRWYPTCRLMPNGRDVFVVAGLMDDQTGNSKFPEIWDSGAGLWRSYPASQWIQPTYPVICTNRAGTLFDLGPLSRTIKYGLSGKGSRIDVSQSNSAHSYGSSAMYLPGKVLLAGGQDPPTSVCETIDINSPTPAWSLVSPLPSPRRQVDLTILPTGNVLLTGGSSAAGFNNAASPVYDTELWNPSDGTWTPLAPSTTSGNVYCYRGYHSNAVLLPDGTVFSSAGNSVDPSTYYPNFQIFSPPYIGAADQPVLASVPQYGIFGSTLGFQATAPMHVKAVNLVRPASVTHCLNMDQRFIPLSFSASVNGIVAAIPSGSGDFPPGYYYLFAVSDQGTPSQASIVHIGSDPLGATQLVATPMKSDGTVSVSFYDPARGSGDYRLEGSINGQDYLPINAAFNSVRSSTTPGSPFLGDQYAGTVIFSLGAVKYVRIVASALGSSSYSYPLRVAPSATMLQIQGASVQTEGDATFFGLVLDQDGVPLSGCPVNFYADGSWIANGTSDAYGRVQGSWVVTPGTSNRTITAIYAGNPCLAKSQASANLSVALRPTSIALVFHPTALGGQVINFAANIQRMPDLLPLVKQESIIFSVNGVPIGSVLTDQLSSARISYHVPHGTALLTVSASFAGDDSYGSCMTQSTLAVTK